MAITYHKAVADTGGAIGTEIGSGDVGSLLPKITLSNQNDGVIISRKFYIKNNHTREEAGTISLESSTPFTAILFSGTGSAQVVGDLTGAETDESPISFSLPVGASSDYWVQVLVPASSTESVNYETVSINLNY